MKKKISLLIITISAMFCTIGLTLATFNSTANYTNKFKAESYEFSIDASGGTFNNEKVILNGLSATLPSPYRKGYTFAGYSNTSGGNVIYSNNISNVENINNRTIYAKWNIITYNISYDLDGGSISNQPLNYNVEKSITLPTPSKTGYTFIGWSGTGIIDKNTSVTIPKGSTGNRNYTANWQRNYYSVDINSIIQNVKYGDGLSGFTFSVWINNSLVANNVKDFYKTDLVYNDVIRVVVNNRTGYSIKSFKDQSWTVTSNLEINPSWYDDIPPVITSFSVTNLGMPVANRWDIKVYINGYDEGTGVQKYQNWLVPYGIGVGAEKADGNERTLKKVMYLNTASGRTFCASIVDNAGNESEKCETIKVN